MKNLSDQREFINGQDKARGYNPGLCIVSDPVCYARLPAKFIHFLRDLVTRKFSLTCS